MITVTGRSGSAGEFAVCIRNGEYEVDLVVGKIYRVLRRKRNDRPSDIRIVDESGEDYLYPQEWFVSVDLPAKARKATPARCGVPRLASWGAPLAAPPVRSHVRRS